MTQRLIVPIDFSDESERALAHALALSGRSGIPVDLMSIAAPHDLAAASDHLRALAAHEEGIASWAVVESARPIVGELAKEMSADRDAIWVVGSHVRTSVGEMVFGSVSEDLAREVERPMVIVGPHAGEPRRGGVLAVALDGTTESEKIIPVAVAAARALGLRMRLVQVLTEPVPADVSETAYLARTAAAVDEPGCCDYDVLHGDDVVQALVDHAVLDDSVVMLAMSTDGVPAGTARLIAGSTTFDAARHVPVPVLVFHPAPAVTVQPPRIVVGLDSMVESGAAVAWAADEAERRNLPLTIVRTWMPAVTGLADGAPLASGIEIEDAASFELDRAVSAVRGLHPQLEVDGVLAQDSPSHQLVEQSDGAELLVVGSRHRGRLAQVLGLSVSSSCAHRAHCPVVVVPSPDT